MKEYRNFIFCLDLIWFSFGTHLKATTWKKQGLQNPFDLLFTNYDFKMYTQNTNHANRLLSLQSSPLLLVSKRQGSSKIFCISFVAFLFLYFFLFSELIYGFCHCDRVPMLLNGIALKRSRHFDPKWTYQTCLTTHSSNSSK